MVNRCFYFSVGPPGLLVVATCCLMLASGNALAATPTSELRQRHDGFDKALAALGEEQYDTAITALAEIASSEDADLAADATFYLGRAYLMQEKLEEAKPLFAKVVSDMSDATSHASEALFYRGVCEIGLLERAEAFVTFTAFVEEGSDAPEHLRSEASDRLSELQSFGDGTLDDAHQRMDFARRKLALEDTGQTTQDEQDNVIAILTALIDEDEDQQQQPGGS